MFTCEFFERCNDSDCDDTIDTLVGDISCPTRAMSAILVLCCGNCCDSRFTDKCTFTEWLGVCGVGVGGCECTLGSSLGIRDTCGV